MVRRDPAAGGRDAAGWGMQDPIVGSGEGAFLDGDIADNVKGVHVDVRVGEGAEPACEELGTRRLALAA
jgi:hypothetical protein